MAAGQRADGLESTPPLGGVFGRGWQLGVPGGGDPSTKVLGPSMVLALCGAEKHRRVVVQEASETSGKPYQEDPARRVATTAPPIRSRREGGGAAQPRPLPSTSHGRVADSSWDQKE
jgi:hypothetical protein